MLGEKRDFLSELEERVGKLHPDSPHSRIFSGIIEGFREFFLEIQELAELAKKADFSIYDFVKKRDEVISESIFFLNQEVAKIRAELKTGATAAHQGGCSGITEDRLGRVESRMADTIAISQRMDQLDSKMADVVNISRRIDQIDSKAMTMYREFTQFKNDEKNRRSDIQEALEDLTDALDD
jgi:hypothetical protein